MENLFFSLLMQVFSLTFQVCFWLLQLLVQTVLPWCFRHAFYFSSGVLFVVLAPMVQVQIDSLLAFGIGVSIAAALDWFLSNVDPLYRQIVFGSIGLAAGWVLNMGPFPLLALAGLSVWQSQRYLN
ncbi:hypothetical protein [Kamptonema sp. UHCC 0994]|uniref:hypothetical protein n=1 Tax=Kamptonema sp. UHCC 0994 TaxID=3031329 RepID=UPI0023B9C865|nr:hypothetical protein [Kamptonema sp. UHCC 0994]MDF0555626.1 hypothetical protein [Kamptonema sp. UHCC 0994]